MNFISLTNGFSRGFSLLSGGGVDGPPMYITSYDMGLLRRDRVGGGWIPLPTWPMHCRNGRLG